MEVELMPNLRRGFVEPPIAYWPRPLWFWNDTRVEIATLREQMRQSRDLSKYGGFGILPFGKGFGPDYLGEEYFSLYGKVLDTARQFGMTMSLYDEYGFPSGSAGAPNSSDVSLFATRFPELTLKRLDKHEDTVIGPARYASTLPAGRVMSVVAMRADGIERVDLSGRADEGRIEWDVPEGTWKVMCFVCVADGYPGCDYLDPSAVEKFVEITHQAYYERFKEHFGTTIDSTFHDEPTLYRGNGRTWTPRFNERFEARYGLDLRPFYPALWYDIGPETAAARNYLFGFRAQLYGEGFPKVIQDWCDRHGIEATGHQDQEEVVNPVSVSGDLMKCFQHQAIPGVDKIGGDRPAERIYKVISSAAYNWDKMLVMSETYGAMGDLSWPQMYAVALEQYTKGINMLIPHAVWYDDGRVVFKPELSYRSPIYGQGLSEFNTFVARMHLMLQNDTRHICDIAVLYPIATLQAGHYLDGPLGFYAGGVTIDEADYLDVGEVLIGSIGRDYTFIHPDVLDEKCDIEDAELRLRNRLHPGRFKVLVLPGHKTIRWSNLAKIQRFVEAGGTVIATGALPSKSAEFGHDGDVRQTVARIFATGAANASGLFTISRNERGGAGIHLTGLAAAALRGALDAALDTYDVEFEGDEPLRYIHKVSGRLHIYLFANITDHRIRTAVRLRGRLRPQMWNPHTGRIGPADPQQRTHGDIHTTVLPVDLPPCESTFVVAQE